MSIIDAGYVLVGIAAMCIPMVIIGVCAMLTGAPDGN